MKNIHEILLPDIECQEFKNSVPSFRRESFNPKKWSAVSVCVFIDEYIFFIKRSEHMPSFKGHLAFFGGHKKDEDKTVFDAAAREFEEESHLDSSKLEYLGVLPPVFTVASQYIVPVVCRYNLSLNDFLKTVRSNGEWVYGLAVPFDHFCQSRYWSWAKAIKEQHSYPVYFNFIPREKSLLTHRVHEGQVLWGATAKIMWSLLNLYHS